MSSGTRAVRGTALPGPGPSRNPGRGASGLPGCGPSWVRAVRGTALPRPFRRAGSSGSGSFRFGPAGMRALHDSGPPGCGSFGVRALRDARPALSKLDSGRLGAGLPGCGTSGVRSFRGANQPRCGPSGVRSFRGADVPPRKRPLEVRAFQGKDLPGCGPSGMRALNDSGRPGVGPSGVRALRAAGTPLTKIRAVWARAFRGAGPQVCVASGREPTGVRAFRGAVLTRRGRSAEDKISRGAGLPGCGSSGMRVLHESGPSGVRAFRGAGTPLTNIRALRASGLSGCGPATD